MSSMPLTILMADDDDDDRMLTQLALEESRLTNPLDFVNDGVELLDYLLRRGAYEHLKHKPLPGLILLDLNMPRVDGRQALEEIKAHKTLRYIPVIILTTSKAEEDMYRSYDLGANAYIRKPVRFEDLVQVIGVTGTYWLEIVEVPRRE